MKVKEHFALFILTALGILVLLPLYGFKFLLKFETQERNQKRKGRREGEREKKDSWGQAYIIAEELQLTTCSIFALL